MTIHLRNLEDESGDLVDQQWFCSAICYEAHGCGFAAGHAYPGGVETDYDVHCTTCGELLWEGLES